jgi:hypothetical protein
MAASTPPTVNARVPVPTSAPARALAQAAGSVADAAGGATPSAGQVGWRASEVLGRIFALLLLPLSIAPVLLLGPSVLRAPVALAHEGWGDVQRLERQLDPERPYRPPPPSAPGPSVWQVQVSLGPIYGRWSESPGAGREGIAWRGTQ